MVFDCFCFDFFCCCCCLDTNRDGYISASELQNRLALSSRGPTFDPSLIKQMIKTANSYHHSKGVSFEQFLEILQVKQTNNTNRQMHSTITY